MTTTTSTLTASIIREAVDSVDSWGTLQMYGGAYSGRGMNGRTCVAVVADSPAELVALGAAIAMVIAENADGDPDEPVGAAIDAIDDALNAIRGAHLDNMGMDYVVYWPNIPAEDAS